MSRFPKQILTNFQKRWQLLLMLQVLLYALCAGVLVYLFSTNLIWALAAFTLSFALLVMLKKPWKISMDKMVGFLDHTLEGLENSTGLLLRTPNELSSLALLQQDKIAKRLGDEIANVRPDVSLKTPFVLIVLFTIITFLGSHFKIFNLENSVSSNAASEAIVFKAVDTTEIKIPAPVISSQEVTITYPAYTKRASQTTSKMSVKALEGSRLHWKIQFNTAVDSVFMERNATAYAMQAKGNTFTKTAVLTESGFYNFKFHDAEGATYISDIYALEMEKDERPLVEIQNLKQFSTFEIGGDQILNFNTKISDDFGIADAYIIATVTKGEGESVKFREERLGFNTAISKQQKTVDLHKVINLKSLKMEAGDELYFYVEAIDVKQPKPNRSRSETYFAVIRDTTTNSFAVEGTMGADLMPDYFRSQRQLIIDTEKLIADKGKLSKGEFNSKSNELGYDQKALRLKYGKFMGDEADSGIQTQEIEVTEEHDHEHDEKDPLASYSHDHDGSNEHNLVAQEHDHEEENPGEEKEDPLENYLHNHDDPEESTLFTQSLKGKLRQAMNEMWDAELQLRLYTPENSLVYQYRALKLIQEIKNSARIYVHRIGFDPPPIKEDKRLSGDLKKVKTVQKKQKIEITDAALALRKTVARINEILTGTDKLTKADQQLFTTAGNELAQLAIDNPSRYLHALQDVKQLSESTQISNASLKQIQSRLLKVLPSLALSPAKKTEYHNELHTLLLKELEPNE